MKCIINRCTISTTQILNLFILLSLLVFVCMFYSCTEEITFDGEITAPRLVVHSYITPDEPIEVNVTQSNFFTSDTLFIDEKYKYPYNGTIKNTTEFKRIYDAEVKLYVNGEYKETIQLVEVTSLFKSYFLYKSVYLPQLNDKIKLVVKANPLKEVVAETHFVQPVEILSVDTTRIYNQDYYEYLNDNDLSFHQNIAHSNFAVRFKDDGNIKNYYRLFVERIYIDGSIGHTDTIISYDSFEFNDIVSGNQKNQNPLETALDEITGLSKKNANMYNIFTDELFNGKVYTLNFIAAYGNTTYGPKYPGDRREHNKSILKIKIQSITKDYYNYLASRNASEVVNNFFSEPVQIKSNIRGGIGVLGAYTNSNEVQFLVGQNIYLSE